MGNSRAGWKSRKKESSRRLRGPCTHTHKSKPKDSRGFGILASKDMMRSPVGKATRGRHDDDAQKATRDVGGHRPPSRTTSSDNIMRTASSNSRLHYGA